MFSIKIARFVLLIIFLCTASAAPRAFILKGRRAREGEFPYAAALRVASKGNYDANVLLCGGSIISRNYILTAAHCFPSYIVIKDNEIFIRVGSTDCERSGDVVNIDEIIIHPNYRVDERDTPLYDIALIKLVKPLEFNDNIQPIRLATHNPPDRAVITLAGWGKTCENCLTSQFLLFTATTLKYHCESEWELCLHSGLHNGVCVGDSGGPAIYNNTLVGVASYVNPSTVLTCGSNNPDVFTSIAYFRKWVLQNSDVKEDWENENVNEDWENENVNEV